MDNKRTNAELLELCEKARREWKDAEGDDILEAGVAEEYMPSFGTELPRLVRENEALRKWRIAANSYMELESDLGPHASETTRALMRLDEASAALKEAP